MKPPFPTFANPAPTALGWVEYCNSDRNSYYANLRRKNGREKPYNVRIPSDHPQPSAY